MGKVITKLLIITLILSIYIFYNLKSNSVYYAKNMPKGEGQYPELVMLIDNLDWVYTPDIEGIKYRIDGLRTIIDITNNYKSFGNIYSDEIEYTYSDKNDVSYRFSKNFDLKHATRLRVMEVIDISSIDKNKLIKEIEEFVKPIIDQQPKPFINLQWLFNLIYHDEFK